RRHTNDSSLHSGRHAHERDEEARCAEPETEARESRTVTKDDFMAAHRNDHGTKRCIDGLYGDRLLIDPRSPAGIVELARHEKTRRGRAYAEPNLVLFVADDGDHLRGRVARLRCAWPHGWDRYSRQRFALWVEVARRRLSAQDANRLLIRGHAYTTDQPCDRTHALIDEDLVA